MLTLPRQAEYAQCIAAAECMPDDTVPAPAHAAAAQRECGHGAQGQASECAPAADTGGGIGGGFKSRLEDLLIQSGGGGRGKGAGDGDGGAGSSAHGDDLKQSGGGRTKDRLLADGWR